MRRTAFARLNGPQRITGVDLARGLAVLGMFAAHLLVIERFDWAEAATWVDVANGRSSILFATLAGVSIGLVTGGTRPVDGEALRTARLRLALRAAILWVLGIVLILTGVPIYVILPAYAVLFLLALPFLRLSARALLPLAGALGLVTPLLFAWLAGQLWARTPLAQDAGALVGWNYPFVVWIAFVLAGLGLARADVRRLRTQVGMVLVGGVLAAAAYTAAVVTPATDVPFWGRVWTAQPHSSGVLEVIGSGGFAVGVLGLCLLLCRTALVWLVLPLRAVGAMPLTAYTAQVIAWAVVAAAALGDPGDLAGIRELGFFWPLTIATVVGCTAWALLVGRGPLEWGMDAAARRLVPGGTGRVVRLER